ncbi:MAG: hypothetical protein BGO77_05230 [Caedibacter sp. 37-49]|nr:MAG: hypothetical protein BGO77_05230 [Caedibacter sp. 37-49]
MKFSISHTILIAIFLHLSIFKISLATNSSNLEETEGEQKTIPITLISQIRSVDCKLIYSFFYKNLQECEKNSISIPKQVKNNSQTISFLIKKRPISYISLILYPTIDFLEESERDTELTALGLFNQKQKIRTISKITIKLIQEDGINIMVQPEYDLPPPFQRPK